MQRHAEEPFVLRPDKDLVDGDRRALLARYWIDAGHALAGTLGHPEVIVRSPSDFPGKLQSGRENPAGEGLYRLNAALGGLLRRSGSDPNRRYQEGYGKSEEPHVTPPALRPS